MYLYAYAYTVIIHFEEKIKKYRNFQTNATKKYTKDYS